MSRAIDAGSLSSRKRCVIYARVSTDKQAEQNISIPDQIARARVYADVQGWEVIAEYVDAGASGRDDQKRPNFRRMIEQALLTTRPFDFILVHSFSRFYRHQARSELVREELKRNRVQVRSLTQEIVDDGGGGTFALSVMGLIDEYQSRENAKHTRRAMLANAKDGFRNGGNIPFGYKLEVAEIKGGRPKKRLAVNPEEAQVVRLVFNLASSGIGIRRIAQSLNAQGYLTRTGRKFFSIQIGRMLGTETYVGRSYYRPRDPITGEQAPKSEWIVIHCEPIVDEGIFSRVQASLKRRAPRVSSPRHVTSGALLGGVAHCGSCQSLLALCTGTSKKQMHRYYRCSGHVNRGGCEGGNPVSVREDVLDKLVLDALATRLLTSDRLKQIAEALSRADTNRQADAETRRKALQQEVARLRREEKNLWDLAGSLGLSASDGFKAKLEALETQRINAARTLIDIEYEAESIVTTLTDDEACKLASELRDFLQKSDPDLRRRFLRTFVTSVIVYPTEVEVSGPTAMLREAVKAGGGVFSLETLKVRASDQPWVTSEFKQLAWLARSSIVK